MDRDIHSLENLCCIQEPYGKKFRGRIYILKSYGLKVQKHAWIRWRSWQFIRKS